MRYCGYCGRPNEDTNIRCTGCGAFLGEIVTQQPVRQQAQFQEITPPKKLGILKNIVIYILLITISALVVVGGLYIYNFTSYRRVINNFEIYFDNYEPEKVVDMYSEAAFYESNDQSTNYKSLDDDAKQKIRGIYDYFGDKVGDVESIKLKFKVTKDYRMSDDEYKDFMDNINYPNKADVIGDARVAEIKITALLDGQTASKTVKLVMTLEKDDKWKIYSFEEL